MRFRFHKKNAKPVKNTLQKQKISKRENIPSFKKSHTTRIMSLLFSTFLVLLYLMNFSLNKDHKTGILLSGQRYEVFFEKTISQPIKTKILKDIEAIFKKHKRSFDSLETLVETIQKNGGFKTVQIIETVENRFLITIIPHTPMLKFYLHNYKVSKNATIYYDPYFNSKFETTLKLNLGKTKPEISVSHLELKNIKILKDAIQLVEEANRNRFLIHTLEYIEHRGFRALLKKTNIYAMFGFPPFSDKLKRLKKVIQTPSEKKIVEIELDYKDKAFVKESS